MPTLDDEIAVLWKDILPHKAYVQGLEGSGGRILEYDPVHLKDLEKRISRLWKGTADLGHRSFLRFARARLSMLDPCYGLDESIEALGGHLMLSGPGSDRTGELLSSISRRIKVLQGISSQGPMPYELRLLILDRTFKLGQILSRIMVAPDHENSRDVLLIDIKKIRRGVDFQDVKETTSGGVLDLIDSSDNPPDRGLDTDKMIRDMFSCRTSREKMENDIQMELYRMMPLLKDSIDKTSEQLDGGKDIDSISRSISMERKIEGDQTLAVQDIRDHLWVFAEASLIDRSRTSSLKIMEAPVYLSPLIDDGLMFNFNGLSGEPGSILYLNPVKGVQGRMSLPGALLMLIRNDIGSRSHFLNSFAPSSREISPLDLLSRHPRGYADHGFRTIVEDMILGSMKEDPGWMRLMLSKSSLKEGYDEEKLFEEIRFLSIRDRVLYLISALCDIRVNSGSVSLSDYIRWIHIITGMDFGTVLPVCLEAMSLPGSRSTSMINFQVMEQVFQSWSVAGRSRKDFLKRSSSIGYPVLWSFKERMDL